jgi:tetratricopeptide (TPR) repeat protein
LRALPGALERLIAALVAAAAFGSPAFANPVSLELSSKFARGEYLAAAAEAEAGAGADELAFAARSLLAHCMTGNAGVDAALLDRARRDAEAALKIDPAHEEGKLQLAIALSLKSRDMDAMAAWNAGYGEKGKKLAEGVLKSDPDNYYAHGFLAVWNIEVERRGGGMGAWMMGASLDAARKHYDTARSLAPDDVGIHWQYARALAGLDLNGRLKDVNEALARAIASVATDHVEQVMQARARQLSEAVGRDREAAQELARKLL